MALGFRLAMVLTLWLGLTSQTYAAGTPAAQWDALLEVSYKFSWYPRQDLQHLLEMKSAEYEQSLTEYRDLMLEEITGGTPARIDPDDFRTGLPWRKYYRLALAEFSLFLADDQALHLQNAAAALSVLAKKAGQPEIEYWTYLIGAHQACAKRDRAALIANIYRIWQNVILRFELETLLFPSDTAQTGFIRSLPHLYENVANLVIRKGIVEKEIAELYPLGAVILDIQPKMTLENGHQAMLAQVVERMGGVASDNGNLNFAVALLEATANRYDFEDEKDETQLPARYNLVRKYYQMASSWADSGKGKAAILTQEMGFMNYLIRRYGDRPDLLLTKSFFNNAPAFAYDTLEKAFALFDRLAAAEAQKGGFGAEGFEDRETYLQSMHQLLDSTAKLSIVLSSYNRSAAGAAEGRDIYPAVRPLQQYCHLFARHAAKNSDILPDNAYFLAAYAARDLAALYRAHTRYSTDDRASALAFAYQLQAAEIFPLDLPGILQLAFQSTLDGRVRDYVQHSSPLAARLRISTDVAGWPSRHPGEFPSLVALMPTVVPEVIENALTFLPYLQGEEISEDALFTKAVRMAETLAAARSTASQEKVAVLLTEIGADQSQAVDAGQDDTARAELSSYYELKSRLYASPDSPIHGFLRTLFHEVPYENHPYVGLLRELR